MVLTLGVTISLEKYLPQGNCKTIITSRNEDWLFPVFPVGPFNEEDAATFLCKYTGQKKDHKENKDVALQIAEKLDYLPTALERAAKLLINKQESLENYSRVWEDYLVENTRAITGKTNLSDRNTNFVGREMSLVALEETFEEGSPVVITAKRKMASETGLGGIGKTQIALQYAYRNADKYPWFVWWINSENESTIAQSYQDLGDHLGVILSEEEKKQEHAMVKKVHQMLENQSGWLLIFDNAENQDIMKPFFPKKGGHVLITSRSPDWDMARVFEIK